MIAVLKYAEELHHGEVLSNDKLHENSKPISAMLSQYLRIDKVFEMHDQDRNALWSRR